VFPAPASSCLFLPLKNDLPDSSVPFTHFFFLLHSSFNK
jgi:hypothetical protein